MSALADRRRILGPTDSVLVTRPKNEIISEEQDQNIFIKLATTENATGSSFLEQGQTVIQTSVHGPKPIRGAFSQHAELTVDVEFSRFCDISSDVGKDISSFLESCFIHVIQLDLYPKSAISINISVISTENDIKSLIANALNGASIALVDAGISLSDIPTAGSIRQNTEYGNVECIAGFMIAKSAKIVGLWIDGDKTSEETIQSVLKQCKRKATEVRKLINNLLFTELRQEEAVLSKFT